MTPPNPNTADTPQPGPASLPGTQLTPAKLFLPPVPRPRPTAEKQSATLNPMAL